LTRIRHPAYTRLVRSNRYHETHNRNSSVEQAPQMSSIAMNRASNLRKHYRSCPRQAFTLIELLVVASIIALLISLLLPSLKRARQQAKSVMCLANIKAIAAGSLTYAGEDQHEQRRAHRLDVGEG